MVSASLSKELSLRKTQATSCMLYLAITPFEIALLASRKTKKVSVGFMPAGPQLAATNGTGTVAALRPVGALASARTIANLGIAKAEARLLVEQKFSTLISGDPRRRFRSFPWTAVEVSMPEDGLPRTNCCARTGNFPIR